MVHPSICDYHLSPLFHKAGFLLDDYLNLPQRTTLHLTGIKVSPFGPKPQSFGKSPHVQTLPPRYGQSFLEIYIHLHTEPALTRYSALSIFSHKSLWTQKYFSSFQPRFRLHHIHTSPTLASLALAYQHNTQILSFVENYLNLYFHINLLFFQNQILLCSHSLKHIELFINIACLSL